MIVLLLGEHIRGVPAIGGGKLRGVPAGNGHPREGDQASREVKVRIKYLFDINLKKTSTRIKKR